MTPPQRDQLINLATQMRAVAYPVGSKHAWWDDILDYELMARRGGLSALGLTIEECITEAQNTLAVHHDKRARWRAGEMELPYGGLL